MDICLFVTVAIIFATIASFRGWTWKPWPIVAIVLAGGLLGASLLFTSAFNITQLSMKSAEYAYECFMIVPLIPLFFMMLIKPKRAIGA